MILFLVGCPPKHVEVPVVDDPVSFLDKVRSEPAPGPMGAPFSIRLATPESTVTASGSLVVSPPSRFRLELRGPIGGPALIVASDGTTLSAWQAGKNRFYTVSDASLRSVAGVGLEVTGALLLGRLPALGEPAALEIVDGQPRYTWEKAQVTLDPATGHLAALEVAPVLTARLLPAEFPEALHVALPQQGVTADLDFGDWVEATPADALFTLTPPEGAEVREIVLAGTEAGGAAP